MKKLGGILFLLCSSQLFSFGGVLLNQNDYYKKELKRLIPLDRSLNRDQINQPMGSFNRPPLHIMAADDADIEYTRALLQHGANVNSKILAADIQLATPLHRAAHYDAPNTVELLLSHGADPDAQSVSLQTPLHACCSMGFDPREERKAKDRVCIVNLLLSKNANPNLQNDKGETPLFALLRNPEPFALTYHTPQYNWFIHRTVLIRSLLKAGINTSLKNKEGKTALQIADVDQNLVQFLLEEQKKLREKIV